MAQHCAFCSDKFLFLVNRASDKKKSHKALVIFTVHLALSEFSVGENEVVWGFIFWESSQPSIFDDKKSLSQLD